MNGCAGPLVFYACDRGSRGIFYCAACGFIVCTGGDGDEAHALTSIIRGLKL